MANLPLTMMKVRINYVLCVAVFRIIFLLRKQSQLQIFVIKLVCLIQISSLNSVVWSAIRFLPTGYICQMMVWE